MITRPGSNETSDAQDADEMPRPPPPPDLTWEELEQGKAGQLSLPTFTPVPTMAERAFLALAQEWQVEYQNQTQPRRLTNHMGDLALACLLLSVEWGKCFTDVASAQMEVNRITSAEQAKPSWMNELPWKLCQASSLISPVKSGAIRELIANLDHGDSGIRSWMMEIAWMVVPWLDPVQAANKLLKNLADTLIKPFESAGLAARLFKTEDSFWTFAREYIRPPARGEDEISCQEMIEQYNDRLKLVKTEGIFTFQGSFWETEAICRKIIERSVLGCQLEKPGTLTI